MNASSLRRSAGALQPRRGGVDNEPEWKLYEEGDPRLYENWKGKVSQPKPRGHSLAPAFQLNEAFPL